MSLENILCPAQQAGAVLDLILDNPQQQITDDTLLYALYSVQANVSRILKAVDECFDKDHRMAEKLLEMGILEEVMRSVVEVKPAQQTA